MRFLTDEEAELYGRLRRTIAVQRQRNETRSQYAEAEQLLDRLSLRLPSGRLIEQTPLHWPAKAIQVFSSRLMPTSWTMRPGSSLLADLEAAYGEADGAFAEQLAIRSALRHGCAFVFTSQGDPAKGEPQVIISAQSAFTATCEIDRRSRMVTAALEILAGRNANLYLPGKVLTVQAASSGRLIAVDERPGPQRVMCAPYVHDASIEKPFGSSRITKPVMGFTDAAVRTFMRSEVSAEWYAAPRERLLGVGADAFGDDDGMDDAAAANGWAKSVIGGIDVLPDIHPDDDPLVPDALRRATVSFAPQMSMQPFSDQFRLIASQFSGASSIPLSYLGIVQDSNPTSAPAIEAQDIDLVRAVKDQQPSLNMGRRSLGINILTLLHPGKDIPADEVRSLTPKWGDPRVRSTREQGDFVASQVRAGNFQAGTRATLDLLPISPDEAAAHAAANLKAVGSTTVLASLQQVAGATASLEPAETPSDLKAKADALGALIRSGVDPTAAAERVGLDGLEFTGAMPVSLRLPQAEAAQLEGN